jgi:hypothetical protein
MLVRMRREFRRKYCLHPSAPIGCSNKIASAHSVQRAILEDFIAHDGHVAQIKITSHVDDDQRIHGLLAKPERVGINQATTFFGFCSAHDSELFRGLETGQFAFHSEQIALLGYRAVCRELYGKDAEIAALDALRNYAAINPDTYAFAEKDRRHKIVRLGRVNARLNLALAKDRYAAILSTQSELRYYGIKFSAPPVYCNTVAFLPEWDFEGQKLQDLSFIAEYKPICFSAWVADGKAAAIFCWHRLDDNVCVPFIDSLRRVERNQVADRLLSMTLEVSDNVVFREDWWESIRETDRQRLVDRAFNGLGEFDRTSNCLADDGLNALGRPAIDQEFVGY